MKTILIAPTQTDLAMAPAEIQDVANLLGAELVLGVVDLARVFRELNSPGKTYELIWFASHGDDSGIHLTDTVIDGDTLAAALRGTKARLIMLNTCSSERAAEQLYSATRIPVICNVGAVADSAAYATARRFAQEIAAGLDAARAFTLAKTKTFRLIPEDLRMYPRSPDDMDEIRREIGALRDRSDDYYLALYGRPGEPGIVSEWAKMADSLRDLRIVLWALVVMMIVMAGTLAAVLASVWSLLP